MLYSEDLKMWMLKTYVRRLVYRIRGAMTEAWEHFRKRYTAPPCESELYGARPSHLANWMRRRIEVRPRGEHYLHRLRRLYENISESRSLHGGSTVDGSTP